MDFIVELWAIEQQLFPEFSLSQCTIIFLLECDGAFENRTNS